MTMCEATIESQRCPDQAQRFSISSYDRIVRSTTRYESSYAQGDQCTILCMHIIVIYLSDIIRFIHPGQITTVLVRVKSVTYVQALLCHRVNRLVQCVQCAGVCQVCYVCRCGSVQWIL